MASTANVDTKLQLLCLGHTRCKKVNDRDRHEANGNDAIISHEIY
jgi:hypothetical protein